MTSPFREPASAPSSEPLPSAPRPKLWNWGDFNSLALAAIGVAGVLGGLGWLFHRVTVERRTVTHEFLDYVRADEHARAYELASTRLRGEVDAESFATYVDDHGRGVRGSKDDSVSVNPMSCRAGSSVRVSLSGGERGAGDLVYLLLVKEEGKWYVDEIATTEPDEWGCSSD
jgi:hypothetical protein